jgi:hypothetical protein
MPSEIASRPETTTQIIRLVRFAILCTLALAAVLLFADLLAGAHRSDLRFLTENVVMSLVFAIAAEVIVAIAAATWVALWK